MALAVILNLWILEEGDDPHQIAGYVAVSAVILRLCWGFVGGPHSRLSALPLSIASFRKLFQSSSSHDFPGHNPAASWIYVLLWISILALGMTGWLMGLDAFWGDETIETVHRTVAKVVEVMVILHLLGIVIDSIRFKRKTWLSMMTGRRS